MAHNHAHAHAHAHAPTNFKRAFVLGTILNLLFIVVEAGYGSISKEPVISAAQADKAAAGREIRASLPRPLSRNVNRTELSFYAMLEN